MNPSNPTADAPREPDLPSWEVVLAETDWCSLQTAFGHGGNLPEIMARLLEPDVKAQFTALSELSELAGHQHGIYEATAPVTLYVAGILAHPATLTLRPYRDVPFRATLLNWLASTAYDASDDMVERITEYAPGLLSRHGILAAFRDLRPTLYRAVAPFLRDGHEDVREAAGLAALVLVEHPALAHRREHLAVHARRVLATEGDVPNRRVAWRALKAWGYDVTGIEPPQVEVWDCGPHSDGRGDLVPPF
ncbi:hypothetical protein [Streptomyces sp. NPDC060194]|uniref:hypothetical protein n=1 Tax=Streptomyces sp. NPDC060194 TaxID=3347069 RepID=UPI003658A243